MALTMTLVMIFCLLFGAGLVCHHLYQNFIHGSGIDEINSNPLIFYPRIQNYFSRLQKIHGKIDGKKKIHFANTLLNPLDFHWYRNENRSIRVQNPSNIQMDSGIHQKENKPLYVPHSKREEAVQSYLIRTFSTLQGLQTLDPFIVYEC